MCHPSLEISQKEIGSSGRIRTYNPPVNRLMDVVYLVGSSWVGLSTEFVVSRCPAANCSRIVHGNRPFLVSRNRFTRPVICNGFRPQQ
jgi:hypothetical protein